MEEYKANDTIMTIKNFSNGNINSNLPAFSLGIVLWQFPDSPLVVAEFDEVGMQTLSVKDIMRI
jgi:hypothetical protein